MKSQPDVTAPVQEEKRGPEYLANERTFLAWIRTSVAVISLGFLISRFSLWLKELSFGVRPDVRPPRLGTSFVIGELMMAFGGFLAVLAGWRYHVVNRDIEKGRISADRGLILLVTAGVALLAAAMIVYMFTTER